MVMGDIEMHASFPLDDDRFFRRECPLCIKDFKIQIDEDELKDIGEKLMESFLLEQDREDDDGEEEQQEFTCPYCGQKSAGDQWWTQEQIVYTKIYAENIMADIVNENFIRPMKRTFRGSSSDFISVKFEGQEMKKQEPWISPEENDMEILELKCCEEKINIDE